jgi:plasmid maintenance system antidote protein VapI
MKRRSRFKSLRDYVNAQPRTKRNPEIARELGLTPGSLAAFLGWHRVPNRDTALRLSKDFGIDLQGLLEPPQDEAKAS